MILNPKCTEITSTKSTTYGTKWHSEISELHSFLDSFEEEKKQHSFLTQQKGKGGRGGGQVFQHG